MRHRKASTAGTSAHQSIGRHALLAFAVAVLGIALTAAPAQAAQSYATGTPLSSGKYTSDVAVNQATHNAYVARVGSFSLPVEAGGFAAFDSSGSSVACTLTPAPANTHPGSVAVDPTDGDLYVLDIKSPTESKLRTYSESCGEEKGNFVVGGRNNAPVPQIATDSEGNVYLPICVTSSCSGAGQTGVVQKFEPNGTQVALAHPIEGLTKPAAVALDAHGDIFVVDNAPSCTSIAGGRLTEYGPDGTVIHGTGAPLVSGNVTSVAIDRSTGDIFVGKGCGSSVVIEKYTPGGTKLTEFGSGVFGAGGNTTTNIIFNQLAVDQTSGTVYGTDTGHEQVQKFADTSAKDTLSTAVTPGGSGTVKCNGETCKPEYDEGTEITVEASAESGFVFKEWTGGTGFAASCNGSTSPSCTFFLNANSSIEAKFEPIPPPKFTLTVTKSGTGTGTVTSSPSGINCGGDCEEEYDEGTVVTLSHTADPGSEFVEWTGSCSGTGTCEVTMNAPHSVNAVFNAEPPPPHLLTVSKSGSGRVQTTVGHAINCGTRCSAELSGAVQLVAQPSSGWAFKEWEGGDCEGLTTRKCTVTMDQDEHVTAVFSQVVTLTVTKSGAGRVQTTNGHAINCGTRCSATYPTSPVATVELVAKAASGGVFKEWEGGDCEGLTTRHCTVTMNQDEHVKAIFEP